MKNFLIFLIVVLFSCGNDPVPKPKALLRLNYPEANYVKANVNVPFSFEKNELATKVTSRKLQGEADAYYGINVEYPTLKGTIYLTYKTIDAEQDNLIAFLRDAQNLTQKHTIKADEITEQVYQNEERKVYGMFYEIGGNAASQSLFYVTDSITHFLTGSLYFYARPNYDSILPAAHYLKKDIKHIMETIVWK